MAFNSKVDNRNTTFHNWSSYYYILSFTNILLLCYVEIQCIPVIGSYFQGDNFDS